MNSCGTVNTLFIFRIILSHLTRLMKTENFQKSWFQECCKNFGDRCFFFKSNKKYYESAASFLPGILSYSREKWIVQTTTKEFVKHNNFLCVSLLQTPKSRRSRHDGLKEKKIVQIETNNSFCHREIFNSIMDFKENKWVFNLLILQFLPLLTLCKP